MMEGVPKTKAETATDQSQDYKERTRLGRPIPLVRSAPKTSAERVQKLRLRKKLSAAADVIKEEVLCSAYLSSAPSASDIHVNTLEPSRDLRENDDSMPTKVGTSPDILEPICTVYIKEEPLEEFMSPSDNEDAAYSIQEENIDSHSTPLSCLKEEIKVKQEEEEIIDCHVPNKDLELPRTLQGEHSWVSIPREGFRANVKKSTNRNRCSFTGCSRVKAKFPALHFFQFPVENRPKICEQWVRNCNNEALRSMEKDKLKWRVVCDRHFTQESFTSLMRTKLTKEAVPTIFVGADDEDQFQNENHSSFPNTNSCNSPETCLPPVDFIKVESSF